MIGSLFFLALTSFVGVSCAIPFVEQQNAINPYGFPTEDYVSAVSTVNINVNQFKGVANVVQHQYGFDDFDITDDWGLYSYSLNGSSYSVIQQDEFPYDYLNDYYYQNQNVYATLLVKYQNDKFYIYPFWRFVEIDGRVNSTFCFDLIGWIPSLQTDAIAESNYIFYGKNVRSFNSDDWYTFESPLGLTDFGAYYDYVPIFGCGLGMVVSFNAPYNKNDISFLFCCGSRNSDTLTYQDGYNLGYETGYSNGFTNGETSGYQNGYNTGYNTGLSDGLNMAQTSNFNSLFNAIADTPVLFMRSLFGFELFGMNVFAIIMSLITGLIVIYVIKKVWK